MFKRFIASILCMTFIFTSIQPLHAQGEIALPVPGTMLAPAPDFMPLTLKGMIIHPENALKFDFLMDTGNSHLAGAPLKEEALKVMKYFLTALTMPEEDMWVNLSPYEQGRIVESNFGSTLMGRDLLAEDYILKQLTASLIYPEKVLGKTFWREVYQKAQKELGTTQIPVNTFNKVWIVPAEAVVWEHDGKVMIVKSRLKVMLEADYLSLNKHTVGAQFIAPTTKGLMNQTPTEVNQIGSQTVRNLILPVLEKQVNEGEHFAQLRQMYQAMILATWYKKALKESLLTKVYANKKKVAGIGHDDVQNIDSIYKRYIQAFKKGAFNYVKEDLDSSTGQTTPRKYFSGGVVLKATALGGAVTFLHGLVPPEAATQASGAAIKVTAQFNQWESIADGVGKIAAFTVIVLVAGKIGKLFRKTSGQDAAMIQFHKILRSWERDPRSDKDQRFKSKLAQYFSNKKENNSNRLVFFLKNSNDIVRPLALVELSRRAMTMRPAERFLMYKKVLSNLYPDVRVWAVKGLVKTNNASAYSLIIPRLFDVDEVSKAAEDALRKDERLLLLENIDPKLQMYWRVFKGISDKVRQAIVPRDDTFLNRPVNKSLSEAGATPEQRIEFAQMLLTVGNSNTKTWAVQYLLQEAKSNLSAREVLVNSNAVVRLTMIGSTLQWKENYHKDLDIVTFQEARSRKGMSVKQAPNGVRDAKYDYRKLKTKEKAGLMSGEIPWPNLVMFNPAGNWKKAMSLAIASILAWQVATREIFAQGRNFPATTEDAAAKDKRRSVLLNDLKDPAKRSTAASELTNFPAPVDLFDKMRFQLGLKDANKLADLMKNIFNYKTLKEAFENNPQSIKDFYAEALVLANTADEEAPDLVNLLEEYLNVADKKLSQESSNARFAGEYREFLTSHMPFLFHSKSDRLATLAVRHVLPFFYLESGVSEKWVKMWHRLDKSTADRLAILAATDQTPEDRQFLRLLWRINSLLPVSLRIDQYLSAEEIQQSLTTVFADPMVKDFVGQMEGWPKNKYELYSPVLWQGINPGGRDGMYIKFWEEANKRALAIKAGSQRLLLAIKKKLSAPIPEEVDFPDEKGDTKTKKVPDVGINDRHLTLNNASDFTSYAMSSLSAAAYTQPKKGSTGTIPDSGSGKAMRATDGGISFNSAMLNLQIQRDGNGAPLPVSLQPLDKMNIQGFEPEILEIKAVDLPLLLGVSH